VQRVYELLEDALCLFYYLDDIEYRRLRIYDRYPVNILQAREDVQNFRIILWRVGNTVCR